MSTLVAFTSAPLACAAASCGETSGRIATEASDSGGVLPEVDGSRAQSGTVAADSPSCGDTQADPANCGECGRSCQGSACVDGKCQPEWLMTATSCALALDATHVFWASGDTHPGQLTMRPLAGGPPVVLADATRDVTSLAVDADSLYWGEPVNAGPLSNELAVLKKVSRAGGRVIQVAPLPLRPSAIAIDGATLYFTTLWVSTFNPDDQMRRGALMTVSTTGGTPNALVDGLEDAVDIALDAERVYWAHGFSAECSWGCVMAMPRGGGGPHSTIVSNAETTQKGIPAIALDTGDLFWTNAGLESTVMQQPVAGGAPVTIASDQTEPGPIAIDSAYVYWADGTGAVKRAPRGGGPTHVLTQDECAPCALAVDEISVYFIACDWLKRVAK